MICAIHQPNFFPWLGFFDKIRRADRFVFLDSVQFEKKGSGTYTNRVAINIAGRKAWLTAPVLRPRGLWKINETLFAGEAWRAKAVKTLKANYARAPHFKEHADFIFGLVECAKENVAEYNVQAILAICERFGIKTAGKILFASSFGFCSSSNELLIDLTRAAGCGAYMYGGGAGGYQDAAKFREAKIELLAQNFTPQPYAQVNAREFLGGLSVIDKIFNEGFL